MPNQRFILGATWLASLAFAYWLAGVGEAGLSSAGTVAAEGAAPAQVSGEAVAGPAQTADLLSGAAEAQKVVRLVSQARLEIDNGMGQLNLRGMLRVVEEIAELDPARLPEALAEVERTVKDPAQRDRLRTLLLGRWAEADGAAAMAYAQEKLPPESRRVRNGVLGIWAAQDPEAAWRWFQKAGSRGDDQEEVDDTSTTSVLFSGMAANHLNLALQRMAAEGIDGRLASVGLAASAQDNASRRRLLERSAALPLNQRKAIFYYTVGNWAASDPEDVAQWLRSQPAAEQKQFRELVWMPMLGSTKPELGAELLLEGTPEARKPQAYEQIAAIWANRDPRNAGAWLARQTQGPELDGARRSYAGELAATDPATAMVWAKSVQNETRRREALESVYTQWRRKDTARADAALEAAGLPAERVQQLKATTPREGGSR